jgi:hypothetical protein
LSYAPLIERGLKWLRWLAITESAALALAEYPTTAATNAATA